jgi:hypothetical protein
MPVVLIGTDERGVAVVGLYETQEMAKEAVHLGRVPKQDGLTYVVMTPELNSYTEREAASFFRPTPRLEQ